MHLAESAEVTVLPGTRGQYHAHKQNVAFIPK